MKIPLSWLKDYVKFESSLDEVAHALTMSGNEVENIKSIGNIEKVGAGEIIFRKVYDIKRDNTTNKIEKSVKSSSTQEGINTSDDRLIPDIINLINRMIQRYSYDEFIAEIESVNGENIFIKMQENTPLLKNTELSVMRQYIYSD